MPPQYHQLWSELDDWEVTLNDGSVAVFRAHAYGEDGDDYVFTALMLGAPMYEYETARIPICAVQAIVGGWTSPRPLAP